MNRFLKRVMDIIISFVTIILLLWLIIILAILVKITSNGPIFFKQERLTKNGKVFKLYKFRSMIQNAEKMGTGLFNYKNDFRVTKIGKFLRKTSLDELPQLFNVLGGSMSLVGPRPPVEYELGDYNNLNKKFKARFRMKAGITGLAQVTSRNEIPWDKKVELDNKYIERFKKTGIFLDIKIMFLTVFSVFRMKSIHEVENEYDENISDEERAKIENERVIAMATDTSGESDFGE